MGITSPDEENSKKNPPLRRGILRFKPGATDFTDITDATDFTDFTDFIDSIEGSIFLPELECGLVGKVRRVCRVCGVSKAGGFGALTAIWFGGAGAIC